MQYDCYVSGRRYIHSSLVVEDRLDAGHIARLCRRGEVPCVRVGDAWYVHESSIVAYFIERNAKKEERKEVLKLHATHQGELRPGRVSFDTVHKAGALIMSVAVVFVLFPNAVLSLRNLSTGALHAAPLAMRPVSLNAQSDFPPTSVVRGQIFSKSSDAITQTHEFLRDRVYVWKYILSHVKSPGRQRLFFTKTDDFSKKGHSFWYGSMPGE